MKKDLSNQISKWKELISQDEPEGDNWLTVEEIMENTGITNTSTLAGVIKKLDKQGKLERFKGRQGGNSKTWYRITE